MSRRVLALCGGVGGAKLALGLDRVLTPGDLTVVVNTADDFEHMGLHISPDVDTVLYTLGDVADAERGWGRAQESWHFMDAVRALGGETWFQLGDRDLAVHVERTRLVREGRTLSEVVDCLARRFGISTRILPMTDAAVRTIVETEVGPLPFQRCFVEQRCAPAVRAIRFDGAFHARPSRAVCDAFEDDGLAAVVICPSNPYLSIDPILAVPGVRDALRRTHAPVVAVSPLIRGQAVKGPTAKLMAELGLSVTNESIATHYCDLIDGLVIDESDAADAAALDLPVLVARTLMKDLADRRRLAGDVMAFVDTFASEVDRTAPSRDVVVRP